MLIYPQQNVIDYLLQIGAPPLPRIRAKGEHRFHHTTAHTTAGCYWWPTPDWSTPWEIGGGGIVYIRLCGSHFVDRTLGYIHISTLPLGGFLKNSSERHITFEIFRLSSILDFHLKRSEFSSHVWWLLAAHLLSRQPTLCSWRFHVAHWRQPIVCSWVDQFHVTHGFHCSFHLVLIICWIKHRS